MHLKVISTNITYLIPTTFNFNYNPSLIFTHWLNVHDIDGAVQKNNKVKNIFSNVFTQEAEKF